MNKKIIALVIVVAISLPLIYTSFQEEAIENKKPIVEITYPVASSIISKIVIIRGTAFDPDGNDELLTVEIMIDDEWTLVNGNTEWNYEWSAYQAEDGLHTILVRAFDGISYSEVIKHTIQVKNPETSETDSHKWAIFLAASNFPKDNESKLGNGALNLAEEMAAYFIENLGYSTSNIIILFDDGWIRTKNGFGAPIETLQEHPHRYDITYGGATKEIFLSTINHVIQESNKFEDSEVFLWISSHGSGDDSKNIAGGKIFESSGFFLWDKEIITDSELGDLLSNLRSRKTCVVVDACYCGGFADKTIFNFPTFFMLRSNIPKSGRIVMTGASKFRLGYASTTKGPLFTQLWFQGLNTGAADGYRPGILKTGRPPILNINKDGKVSVEEAFYYARYTLKTDSSLADYKKMEPQINDQYPNAGLFLCLKGMILGE